MHGFGKKQLFALEKMKKPIVVHSLEELSDSFKKVVKPTSKNLPLTNKPSSYRSFPWN
jgi:hypothetical protein